MAIERLTFSNDLKAKDLYYCDEFFSLKGEKIIPSDSFSYDYYEALRDVNDFKTNNYSNLFLTKKQKTSNWLKSKIVDNKVQTGLVTTLEWLTDKSRWMYFNDTYNIKDLETEFIECLMKNTKSDKYYGNYVFYIDFIDDVHCTISHTYADFKMYLTYGDEKDEDSQIPIYNFRFEKNKKTEFIYQIEGNKIKFYNNEGQVLYLKDGELSFRDESTIVDGNEVSLNDGSEICYIENTQLDFNFYVDSSWVGYDRSETVASVDKMRSSQNLETQALIHHQYNKDGGFNFIPLKNNLTYKGNSVRGNNTNYSDDNYPDVDYRTYTSINSGLNQEKGNENITLSFTFTDQEYEVNGGQTLSFTIPKSDEGQLPSLFPYKQININDTKFIKNGAFGSNVPYFSDKIKMLQDGVIDEDKDNTEGGEDNTKEVKDNTPNNATYLCTWLYKKDDDSKAVWVDRYYYPDFTSREKLFTKEYNDEYIVYAQSKENFIDKINRTSNEYKDAEKIARKTYFDKISDMLIREGTTYHYQRVSEKMVNEVLSNIEKYRISSAISNTNKELNLLNQFLFDGQAFTKIKYDKWNNTNVINLNFDVFLQRSKKMGLQLFGTDYNHGFNIQNRKDLVPFHYYPSENIIYLLNNKFEIVHQFDLTTKYPNETVKKLILGEVFDDVIVLSEKIEKIKNQETLLTENYLYVFSYDLQLKYKVKLSENESDILIKNNVVLFNNKIYIPNTPNENNELPKESDVYFLDLTGETVSLRELSDNSYKTCFDIEKGEIKSLFIDDDGTIYALDYEKYALSSDKDTIYGIKKDEGVYYIVSQSLGKVYGDVDKSKYTEFQSRESIDMIQINGFGDMCIVRSFADGSLDRKRLQVYDITKQKVFDYDMSGYDTVHSLDAYTYLDENGNEQSCFTLVCSSVDTMNRLTYFVSDGHITSSNLHIPTKKVPSDDGDGEKEIAGFPYGLNTATFETVNTIRTLSVEDNNALFFNLHVPSTGICDNKATIKWSLDNIQDGWYNINVYINLDKGIFELKINDEIYEVIKDEKRYKKLNDELINTDEDISWFKQFEHSDGTIFNTTYYFGALGKKYGTVLNKILKNGVEDPYVCVNGKIENVQLYTKELDYYEYQAMRMRGKMINKLILTLPCGNRNCIDEIVRYFKYVATQAISNSIKICIAGTGLQTEGQFNMLRKEIMNALEDNKDCLIKVRAIEFIETGNNV